MAVVYELDAPVAPRSTLGPYRRADFESLPDEPRCELVLGRLLVTPAPGARHQEVVLRLAHWLLAGADREGGRALVAPIDVVLADHSVVQPDVVFVSAARAAIVVDRVEGAPDLVIEVLSPSTRRRDRGPKLRLYAEAGVRECWIVDPEAATFEFFVARDGGFLVQHTVDGAYTTPLLPETRLDLADFWRQVRG